MIRNFRRSVAAPHTRKATITFTDNVKGEDVIAGMGDRGIMISGGTLSLHGDQKNARTKLSATANAGATSIQVVSAAGWRVGDEIVLASTDFDPLQAERRTITDIRPTPSRSTRSSTTCTSARSHSMWTSVAKRVCSHTEEMRH